MSAKKLLLSIVFILSCCTQSIANAKPVLDIQHWNTTHGARVYFVAAKEIPVVNLLVGFAAGSARDGDKAGLASLTNNMLAEGTPELNVDQLANRFENLGAEFNTAVDRDIAGVTLRSVSDPKFFQPALDLMTAVLKNPAFPSPGLQRQQQQVLNAIQQKQQSLNDLASNAFYSSLYDNFPYGHPIIGLKETVPTITVSDLQHFYNQYYVAKNAIIVMVGAIDRQAAEKIATQIDAALQPGQAASALPIAPTLSMAKQQIVEHPSVQTHITTGQLGITRADPDYFPLYLGNHILGGGTLVSRLSDEVREKRGLSYVVYSYFLPLASPGPFIIDLETQQSKTQQALQVVQNTLQGFVTNGPSDQELAAAKSNIIGGFPLHFDSNAAILKNLATLAFYNLPLDYFDTYIARVNAVTTQQVHTAFQKHIQPNKMVTILVGNKN